MRRDGLGSGLGYGCHQRHHSAAGAISPKLTPPPNRRLRVASASQRGLGRDMIQRRGAGVARQRVSNDGSCAIQGKWQGCRADIAGRIRLTATMAAVRQRRRKAPNPAGVSGVVPTMAEPSLRVTAALASPVPVKAGLNLIRSGEEEPASDDRRLVTAGACSRRARLKSENRFN